MAPPAIISASRRTCVPAEPSPVGAGCLCHASRDIASYRICQHGCLYCYAA